MKKGVKILAGALAGFIAVAGITAGAIYKKTDSIIMKESDFPKFYIKDEDAVYFLNTGSSDAVILQSGGHYAMIQAKIQITQEICLTLNYPAMKKMF